MKHGLAGCEYHVEILIALQKSEVIIFFISQNVAASKLSSYLFTLSSSFSVCVFWQSTRLLYYAATQAPDRSVLHIFGEE